MELFPKFNELDEAFNNRAGDLEDNVVRNYKEGCFNKYLEVQDEIVEILEKNEVNKDIVDKITKKFEIQINYFASEMEFWKKYFFKVGVFYNCELDKELKEGINVDFKKDIKHYLC